MTTRSLIFIALSFVACQKPFTPQDLEKSWAINDVEFKDKGITAMNKSTGDMYKNFMPKFHLKLEKNGNSVSFMDNAISLEKWKYNDSTKMLILYSTTHPDVTRYKVVKASDKELRLEHEGDGAMGQIWIMKPDTLWAGNGVDLMAYQANEWRIPPIQKETDQQIRQRVKSMIDYLESYFSLVGYKHLRNFSTQMAKEPIQYYQHGMGLRPESELSPEFVRYFYDKEDALKAYKIIESLFQSMEFPPSDGKSYSAEYAKCYRIMKAML
jgi:hypothetical protein